MTIFEQIAKLSPLRLLPAILDIRQTMMSAIVGRHRIHATSFVTLFRLWNDVSIFCNSEVIRIVPVLPPCWLQRQKICRSLLHYVKCCCPGIELIFGFGMTLLRLQLAKLLLLPVLVRRLNLVENGYVYATWLVTPFRLWNDVGICNYRKVICISGFDCHLRYMY